jgi:hypothetical protein
MKKVSFEAIARFLIGLTAVISLLLTAVGLIWREVVTLLL